MDQKVQEVQGVQELLELQHVQTHHDLPEVNSKIENIKVLELLYASYCTHTLQDF